MAQLHLHIELPVWMTQEEQVAFQQAIEEQVRHLCQVWEMNHPQPTQRVYYAHYTRSDGGEWTFTQGQAFHWDDLFGARPPVDSLAQARSVLGVDEGYTIQELKAARRKLAKQFHPDVSGEDSLKMQAINEAYDLLLKAISG